VSNRQSIQTSFAAKLKLSHELQIEALLKPGLSDEERLTAFAKAIEANPKVLHHHCYVVMRQRIAKVAWLTGGYPLSLFAYLPGCQECPIIAVQNGARYPGIPSMVPFNWDAPTLRAFAKVQQEARIGK